jgi:PAS domain S-box-containing protein
MTKTIPRKIFVGFIASFFILVVIGSLIYLNVRNFLNSNRWEAHTYQVLTNLEYVISDLKDIESGTRGYVITGQEEFLEPYINASKLLKSDLSDLRQLISDNMSQIRSLTSLELQIQQKLEFQQKQVEQRKASNFNAAKALLAEGIGKKMMDEIRRTVSDMKNVENDLLSQRVKRREVSTFDVFAITGITILLLAIMVFIIMVLLKKELIVRKKLQDTLKESLEYSNMIIDTVPNPILVLDANLNIITESRSFYKQFNYSKEDIEGKSFFEIIRGRFDYQELKKLLHSIIPEDASFDHYELELEDNRAIWLNARKFYRPQNNVCMILIGLDDITDKKKVEEERKKLFLLEQNARMEAENAKAYWRSLFEYSPGLYLVLKPYSYEIVAVSEAYLKATMTNRDRIMGKTLFEVFPDDPNLPEATGVRNLSASLRRVEQNKKTDVMAVQLYPVRKPIEESREFEERYWSPINSPVFDHNGNLAFIIHRVEDVTEYIHLKETEWIGKDTEHALEIKAEHMEADIVSRSQELQRLNEQLREVQKELLDAQRIGNIGSWNYSFEMKTLFVSEQMLRIFGIQSDKATLVSPGRFYLADPLDRARVWDAIDHDHSGEGMINEELEIKLPNGETRMLYVRKEISNGSSKRPVKSAGVVLDITEKKISEKKLLESEERFSVAFRTNPDALVISNLTDGTILDVNESFEAISGWRRDEVIGKSSTSLGIYADSDDRKQILNKLRKNGRIRNHETRFKSRTGEEIIGLLSSEHLKLSEGKAVLTIIRDITEIKKAEEALIENRKNLLDAQKLAHLGNYTLDVINNKIEWSDELYEIWEVDKNKPIPPFEELWDKIHPEDREQLKKILTEKREDNNPVETEFRVLLPEGRVKYIHIITKLEFDESGNLLKRSGVEIDVTEKKLAQIELENTLKELERSNKELEQFAYIASHDLQEPLRMVSNYLNLLSQKYEGKLDDKAKGFIEFAVDGAKRMNSLIKGLLSYSRLTTHAKEPQQIDLNEVISNVLKDLKASIDEKNAILELNKLPVIRADDLQMHQLFQNLISNALKFKKDGQPIIKINARRQRNNWLFSVEDNGIGIETEFFERIFIIFQRLHERGKYPGTGLGLAICKKIVERHGGRIWVESEIGKGTTFYFTLAC